MEILSQMIKNMQVKRITSWDYHVILQVLLRVYFKRILNQECKVQ